MENTKCAASNPNLCLRISQADVGQDRREKSIFSGILENVQKQLFKIRPIGDRWGNVWLGSSGIWNFWPSIVTGLRLILRSPPKKISGFLKRTFYGCSTQERILLKKSINVISCVQRSNDRRRRGVAGHRFAGDTTGSWFWNRRFRWRKVRGGYRRTTRPSLILFLFPALFISLRKNRLSPFLFFFFNALPPRFWPRCRLIWPTSTKCTWGRSGTPSGSTTSSSSSRSSPPTWVAPFLQLRVVF